MARILSQLQRPLRTSPSSLEDIIPESEDIQVDGFQSKDQALQSKAKKITEKAVGIQQ